VVLPKLARECGLDVLHVPSYRRLPWRRPCALVATIHDLAPFHVAGKYDWKRTFYARWIVPALARRQDRIIAVSRNTARDIAQFFGLSSERVTVVHNGVEHQRFFPGSREQARSIAAQRHDLHDPFFLYVARLEHPGKNHVRLISAFNRFKAATGSNWNLALGGSDWHGADSIHESIRESAFAGDIRTLGFVSDNDLPDLYRAADCFVYPSLYEGFGMPPVEAMACGCPVICSTRGSLSEVVGTAAMVIEPEDVSDLASALAKMSGDGDCRNSYRAAGLARAAEFDWRHTAGATLGVYEAAVARIKSAPKESGSRSIEAGQPMVASSNPRPDAQA
jgi:glycosyltransferase involved in cell wall biosynthesis